MNTKIEFDLSDMEKKLKCYVEKGRVAGSREIREEPMISVQPDASFIKPLKKVTTYPSSFLAVDCSTCILKRANNWGVYLMRASCVTVKKRQVDWTYSERICTVVGDAHVRRSYLQDFRIELERALAKRGPPNYDLPPSSILSEMENRLKKLGGQDALSLE